jgi:hypothetical protein
LLGPLAPAAVYIGVTELPRVFGYAPSML